MHTVYTTVMGIVQQYPYHTVPVQHIDYVAKNFCEVTPASGMHIRSFEDIKNTTYQYLHGTVKKVYLHKELLAALQSANKHLKEKNCELIVYAGYRSKRMQDWIYEKTAQYLPANHEEKYLHARGLAVTVGLRQVTGEDSCLGDEQPFDFIRIMEQLNGQVPLQTMACRERLKTSMELAGFERSPACWCDFYYKGENGWEDPNAYPIMDLYFVELEKIFS